MGEGDKLWKGAKKSSATQKIGTGSWGRRPLLCERGGEEQGGQSKRSKRGVVSWGKKCQSAFLKHHQKKRHIWMGKEQKGTRVGGGGGSCIQVWGHTHIHAHEEEEGGLSYVECVFFVV